MLERFIILTQGDVREIIGGGLEVGMKTCTDGKVGVEQGRGV